MTEQSWLAALQVRDLEGAEDERLLVEIRKNPAAFASLYRKYLHPIYRYLYSKTGNVPDAEDLTSQVFLAALERLPRYQHSGHLAAWLFAIARRKTADFYRSHEKLSPLEAAAESLIVFSDPLLPVIKQEEQQALAALVTSLPDEDQELLRLRFAGRLSFAEIATLLDRKESAVKMALYRLLERLEKQMEAYHG